MHSSALGVFKMCSAGESQRLQDTVDS